MVLFLFPEALCPRWRVMPWLLGGSWPDFWQGCAGGRLQGTGPRCGLAVGSSESGLLCKSWTLLGVLLMCVAFCFVGLIRFGVLLQ